jgi:hypothetical protein
MTMDDEDSNAFPGEQPSLPYRDVPPATALSAPRRWIWALSPRMLVACVILFSPTAFAQTTDPNSTFSDLSTEYDGGVANPTDGSTGNVLQQALFAAYFWGVAHGSARATVVASSDFPIFGSRLLVPGNVNLICSSYSSQTYTGGCRIYQTDGGNNTATGGSPLLMADYTVGVLPDHKTWCSANDNPQQPGCTIINSSGASIQGFTLYGSGPGAGGADVGVRVIANSVHVQDTWANGFGGPGIEIAAGENDSFDWNYGQNVDMWWCANPSQLTSNLGGMELGMMDSEASHNQYSTGCTFTKSASVSLEYPYLAAMHVGGAGNLIQSNLLQLDGIGLITDGMEHRVVDNRIEYTGREAVRNLSHTSLFSGNRITSACLDPNLINLRPGALDNENPRYPSSRTFLHSGYIIMDPSGNIEQVIGSAGTSDVTAPDWSVEPGGNTIGDELTWENMGPWLTDSSPLSYWAQPSLTTGICYGVYDNGGDNNWSANEVGQEVGVDGYSYMRGSYFITGFTSAITGNVCDGDLPDAHGNGQCWWGGDLYSNGGPTNLAPNGGRVNASGGGTAWVGDYSVVVLNDNIPRQYNDFQGMAEGQTFSVTSSTVANVIDPWGITGSNWNIPGPDSLYGHPSLMTCTGGPLVVTPGSYYDFYYHIGLGNYAVQQVNCPNGANNGVSILPGSVSFPSQSDSTTSAAQTVTVTNLSGTALKLILAVSDDFSQSSTCGGTIAVAASCTISVTFTPTTAGAHVGVLTITPNGSYSSQTVSLSGVGAAPSNASQASTIAISSSVATLEVSPTVQSAKTLVTVTPQGGFVGTVSLECAVVSETQTAQATSPTCSFSPTQVGISSTAAGVSTLVISVTTPSVATTIQRNPYYKGMSLAGLGLLGLLPLALIRRKTFIALLSIILFAVMAGCGYTPNTSTSSYKVVITATSGTQAPTSISIPLNVQVQPAL